MHEPTPAPYIDGEEIVYADGTRLMRARGGDGSEPVETADKPVEPNAPAEPGGSGETPETFSENFDPATLPEELRPAYNQLRADYTRKTQSLAEQRQEADAALVYRQAVEALHSNDPTLQAQAAEFLGIEIPRANEEILDPEEQLRAELAELRTLVEGQQRAGQQAAQEQAQAEKTVADVLALEQKVGRSFDDSELEIILPLAERLGGAQAAYDSLTNAYGDQQKRWISTKRTFSAPGGGRAGSKEIDFSNQEERVRHMAELAMAASED